MFGIDDVLIGLAVSAVVSGIGTAVSGAQKGAGEEQARALMAKAAAQYDIPLPVLEKAVAQKLGPSAMDQIGLKMDPRLKESEYSSLMNMDEVAKNGENAQMRSTMNRVLGDLARQEGAGRNAIKNDMHARGAGGSGAELAMQLQGSQASADRAQTAGLDQAAQSNRRMLDAMMNRYQMASGMRNQEYNELSQAAQAKDMIARYNADARTRAQYYNLGLPQQNFENDYKIRQGKANALIGQSNQAAAQGASAAAQTAGIANGISEGVNSFAGYAENQDRADREDKRWQEQMDLERKKAGL